MVKDINLKAHSSEPWELANVNDTLFFVAEDATTGRELWQSDGSEADTVLVKDINPGPGFGGPTEGLNCKNVLASTSTCKKWRAK